MRLQVTARHGHVNDSVRSYAEEKLTKLERRLHDTPAIERDAVDASTTRRSRTTTSSRQSSTRRGRRLHGREAAATYEAAIDRLLDKLERQVERYRDKRVHERADARNPPDGSRRCRRAASSRDRRRPAQESAGSEPLDRTGAYRRSPTRKAHRGAPRPAQTVGVVGASTACAAAPSEQHVSCRR